MNQFNGFIDLLLRTNEGIIGGEIDIKTAEEIRKLASLNTSIVNACIKNATAQPQKVAPLTLTISNRLLESGNILYNGNPTQEEQKELKSAKSEGNKILRDLNKAVREMKSLTAA